MWYKLSIAEQVIFLVITLWPLFFWVSRYLMECTIDGFWAWLFDNGQREDTTADKTYNCGNTSIKRVLLPKQTENKNTYVNKTKRGGSVSGLVAGERKSPPRAQFFGRLDGKKVKAVGEYDLTVLNQYELAHWKRVCRQKRQQLDNVPDIATKIKKITGLDNIEELNRETAAEMGIIDGETGEITEKGKKIGKMGAQKHFPDYENDDTIDLDAEDCVPVAQAVNEFIAAEKKRRKALKEQKDRDSVDTSGVTSEEVDKLLEDDPGFELDPELDLTEGFASFMGVPKGG